MTQPLHTPAHHAQAQALLRSALVCEAAGKETQEDAAHAFIPDDTFSLTYKGSTFVVADGVSTAEGGQLASHTAVHQFIQDYYKTPDTWSTRYSAEQVLSTINQKLYRHSHAYQQEQKGALCTFSALIIKSHQAYVFHVGDSRIYRFRDQQLEQLTHDHQAHTSQGKASLTRALGIQSQLAIDYQTLDLKSGDAFLLCSDGLHDFVSDEAIQQCVLSMVAEGTADSKSAQPDAIVDALYQKTLASGCDDNVSIIWLVVDDLPQEHIDAYQKKLTALPFPPVLAPGMKVDGYRIVKELYASQRSHLYIAEDERTQEQVVIKTPSELYSDDSSYIERFIQEEWIGSRIQSPYVARVLPRQHTRQFLYYVMEHVQGESLEAWMQRQDVYSLKSKLILDILEDVAKGLTAFHQCEAIHQDLKPSNVMLFTDPQTQQMQAKIIDFGSTFVAGVAEIFVPLEQQGALGTATYADPHYLFGKNTAIQGDIYSLATLAYELFTGALPYGPQIEDCRTPRDIDRLRYIPASRVNPKIPIWLDRALEKGVSFDLQTRYRQLDHFMRDIRHPNPEFLREEVKKEDKKHSMLFWQLLSGFWFITFLFVLYLFVLQQP